MKYFYLCFLFCFFSCQKKASNESLVLKNWERIHVILEEAEVEISDKTSFRYNLNWGLYFVLLSKGDGSLTYFIFPENNLNNFKEVEIIGLCEMPSDTSKESKFKPIFYSGFFQTVSTMLSTETVDSNAFISGLFDFVNMYEYSKVYHAFPDTLGIARLLLDDEIDDVLEEKQDGGFIMVTSDSSLSFEEFKRSSLSVECHKLIAKREDVQLFQLKRGDLLYAFWSYNNGISFKITNIEDVGL